MAIRRVLVLAPSALILLACSEPVGPQLARVEQVSALSAGHRVVGAGHVQQATGLREFTFHAVQDTDGGAGGSFKVVLPNGLFFEADVTCVSVNGSTGWVGGVIRASNAAPVVLGSVSTFYAIDNGEGGAAADIVSIATFNGGAGGDTAFCANQPLVLAPQTVTGGNVQVQ